MQTLQGKRILLVEDESLIALDIMGELQDEGAKVDIAPTITAAAMAIQADTYDAAVVDHALQDGDGSEVCRKLNEEGIPYVMYSGHEQGRLSDDCRDAPKISKPAAPGAISGAIVKLLNPSGLSTGSK